MPTKRSRTMAHVSVQVVNKDVKRILVSDDGERVHLTAGPHEVILDVELFERIEVALIDAKNRK